MVSARELHSKTCILQAYTFDNNSGPPPDYQERPKIALDPGGPIDMSPELGRIFGELSWVSRLQLLKTYYPSPNKTLMTMESLMAPIGPNNYNGFTPSKNGAPRPQPPQQLLPSISQEPKPLPPLPSPAQEPNSLPPLPLSKQEPNPLPPLTLPTYQGALLQRQRSRRADREVGLSALRMPDRPVPGRRQTPWADPPTNQSQRDDDTNMKLKLFRLMYETVRDSDLKVKRAELIKTQYANSSAFSLGYVVGDITDKYNIMSDIAMTLKRLYNDWRPIEHINAYEQIANQAIEISHLIDMAKALHKKKESGGNIFK